MPSLQDRFDPRRNGFDVLRLLFALLVAIAHGISAHTGEQPRIGLSGIGDFGLDGFFVLSGFLVTRSWFRLESFPRFAWHRFLRIMPGFWVCLVVVAFVVALFISLPFFFLHKVSFLFGTGLGNVLDFLAFRPHFDGIARGVLDSGDILYFVGVAAIFIFLAHRLLGSRRWR